MQALEALPFEAPEGYGALVYNQTHGDREVYADELIPGYGALFPIGINTSCLEAQVMPAQRLIWCLHHLSVADVSDICSSTSISMTTLVTACPASSSLHAF